MKTFTRSLMPKSFSTLRTAGLLVVFLLAVMHTNAQSLTAEFQSAGYTLTDLGSVTDLPSQYGGLTIRPEQPNTLYIGGTANYANGALYTVALTRDPVTQHITGLGPALIYAAAPNIDGGVCFAPNGTLLFTRYSMNELGQILPNSSYSSINLSQFGVASSVGSLAFVPFGYPGAGNLIFSSYNGSVLYNVPYTVDPSGQYILGNQIAEVSVNTTAAGPEGIAYIPAGSAGFPELSMVISSYSNGTVVVFEIGEGGLPDISTARTMITGLTGAEGALIDPVTGDFLFSTFGGGDKVIRISGFVPPSAVSENLPGTREGFSIYPNPTFGPVTVDITEHGISGTMEISNILGEKILSKDFDRIGTYSFDITNQPNGVYLLKVRSGNNTGLQRIIKY
jgi:hypothetical protein